VGQLRGAVIGQMGAAEQQDATRVELVLRQAVFDFDLDGQCASG
jgi:hypothetical protein